MSLALCVFVCVLFVGSVHTCVWAYESVCVCMRTVMCVSLCLLLCFVWKTMFSNVFLCHWFVWVILCIAYLEKIGVQIILSPWKLYKVPIVLEGMCFCSGAVFGPPEKEHPWHIHLQAIPTAEWRSETVPEKVVSQSPGSHSAAGRTQLGESPTVKQMVSSMVKKITKCVGSLCSRKKTTWKVNNNWKRKTIWSGFC